MPPTPQGPCPPAPTVPAGTVLFLAPNEWRGGDRPLSWRVARIDLELSRYWNGRWYWVAGEPVTAADDPGVPLVLVHVDALTSSGSHTPT